MPSSEAITPSPQLWGGLQSPIHFTAFAILLHPRRQADGQEVGFGVRPPIARIGNDAAVRFELDLAELV